MSRQRIVVQFACEQCGQGFECAVWYRSQRRAYCSEACRAEARSARVIPIAERIAARLFPEPNSGCWLWDGSRSADGYGNVYSGTRSAGGHQLPLAAHRAVYEMLVGPIPEGLTIDHLCRNRACVNPAHLEPVTMAENIRRSEGMSARHGRATECQRGHAKSEANVYRYPDGRTECSPCRRIRWASFSAKRNAS